MIDIIFLVIFVTLIGLYGLKKKVIDKSGFIASIIVGLGVVFSLPLPWFIPLIILFVLGGLTARYKWDLKRRIGKAERKGGRTYANVFGNGLVPLVSAILYFVTKNPVFIYAYLASVGEACADTVATEIGQLSKNKPMLITNLKRVRPGTSGGISILGEIAAIIAIVVTILYPIAHYHQFNIFIPVLLSSFIGVNVDSIIGATLEDKTRFVNNHVTNFLATLTSAVIVILIL